MDKLVFVYKLLENDCDFICLRCKLTPLHDHSAVVKQDLGVSIPFTEDALQGVAESHLKFLILHETFDKKAVVILNKCK